MCPQPELQTNFLLHRHKLSVCLAERVKTDPRRSQRRMRCCKADHGCLWAQTRMAAWLLWVFVGPNSDGSMVVMGVCGPKLGWQHGCCHGCLWAQTRMAAWLLFRQSFVTWFLFRRNHSSPLVFIPAQSRHLATLFLLLLRFLSLLMLSRCYLFRKCLLIISLLFLSCFSQGGIIYLLLKGSAKVYLNVRHSSRVKHRTVLDHRS